MKVFCSIEEVELEGDHGPVDSVCATCERCGNITESYGTSAASRLRCFALMRETCPEGTHNFYAEDEHDT